MFSNYLKVAFRNLWKNKTFSFINITGLAIGLACFLLIALYVLDELSYDRFFRNADRIYRINSDIRFGGNEMKLPQTSDLMGSTLKKDFPQVEEYTRVYTNGGSKLIRKGREYISEPRLAHVDSTFFRVFSFKAMSGDLDNALDEPNTVVISRAAAVKYFGTADAVGKNIETNENGSTLYKVTAVVEDLPKNSHMQLDLFFSMKNLDYEWGQFLSHNFHTYLLLKDKKAAAGFDRKLFQYTEKYVVPAAGQFMQVHTYADIEKSGNKLIYSLLPLTKIHLYSEQNFEMSPTGNIQYVYVFSAVALFILLIACINFMNLTTARSANRAREVGIRKVLGTERRQLVFQFLSESTLMALLSLVLAIVLVLVTLPFFNGVAAKTIPANALLSRQILPLLLLLPFVVGLVAGSYPAFYLSSFQPIKVLKGKLSSGGKASPFRSVLVVFQFSVSIILIIGTLVIYRQLNYIQSKNMGFDKDQVLVVDDAYVLKEGVQTFKNEVLQMPGVQSGTVSAFLPVSNSSRNDNSYSKTAVMDPGTGFSMQSWRVDYDYLRTMGMKLVRGRNFSQQFGTDSAAVIINEAMSRHLNYDDPIGKQIFKSGNDGKAEPYTIIGVVGDFNFESVKKDISYLGLFLSESSGSISFKVSGDRIASVLPAIEKKWKVMADAMPFNYRFLDDSFDEMYRSEQRVGKLALSFSLLAIFIACLGLFGLATYIAEQRTKEIGIRKVLGASIGGIVQLLSREFLLLVLISIAIATPLAWWAMHNWLQDFAYRVSLGWWVFAIAGLLALVIALATISVQALRAALVNPVKNLRTE